MRQLNTRFPPTQMWTQATFLIFSLTPSLGISANEQSDPMHGNKSNRSITPFSQESANHRIKA